MQSKFSNAVYGEFNMYNVKNKNHFIINWLVAGFVSNLVNILEQTIRIK